MLKVFAMIAWLLDIIVFAYILIKFFAELEETKKVSEAISNTLYENIEKSKSKASKIGAYIAAASFCLVLIIIGLVPLLVFIVKWVQETFIIGLRYFLIYSIFWPLLNAFRRTIKEPKTIANEKDRLTIWMFLSGVFISIIYTIFGFDFTLFEVISYYANSNLMFSNALSVLIPSLFIFSIVLSVYSAFSKMSLLNIKDNYYPHWTKKYPLILTILVIAIYSILIYMSELSIENKVMIDYINMNDTIDIIQGLLSAALIPLIIGVFLNVNSEKKEKKMVEKNKDSLVEQSNKMNID